MISGIPIFHSFSHFFMNSDDTVNKEEEYVPPGERLITPPDVVAIDPEMTVAYIKCH